MSKYDTIGIGYNTGLGDYLFVAAKKPVVK